MTLEHPRDALGRWAYLESENILKAEVPVRTVPAIEGSLVTQVIKGRTKTTATRKERTVWSKSKDGKKKKVLAVNTTFVVVKNPATRDRYNIRSGKATGWIDKSAVDLLESVTLPPNPQGIEEVEPAWVVREQLFRIYEREVHEDSVIVRARHISYDLLGNMTLYRNHVTVTAQEVLDNILGECAAEHEFEAYTDCDESCVGFDALGMNPIKAMLDPEEGVAARFGLELVRDDYELYFLTRAGLNRGVRIEYGKNLLGIKCTVSHDNIATAILPVGESVSGDPIYLTSTTSKLTKTILAASYVRSSIDGSYAAPHLIELKVSDAKITDPKSKDAKSQVTEAIAYQRMKAAAQEKLDAHCDKPEINIKVDFILLGDTEEYKQYSALEALFLYDTVGVRHSSVGIDTELTVVRVVYDCLTGRYVEIELGSLQDTVAALTSWQIPSINGNKIQMGTIGQGAFGDGVISARTIQAEAVEADHVSANLMTAAWLVAGVADIAMAQITTANIQIANIDWAAISTLNAQIADIAKAEIGEVEIDIATIDWASIATLNAQIANVAQAQITAANIESANVQWASIATLNAAIATIAKAQITTAAIIDADIAWASIASLQTGIAEMVAAKIGSADIGYGHIKDLVTGSAIISEGVGGKLFIDRLAVTEANIVSLSVGELMLKGDDGLFYKLSPGAGGAVEAVLVEVEGSNIANATLSGSNMIENTITARELNVGSIFADNAMIGAIKAGNIDVANLFANSAYLLALRTNIIESDIGSALNISSNAAILLKADKTVTDGLSTRMTTAEQKLTPSAIVSTVTSSPEFSAALAAQSGIPTSDAAPANPSVDQLWCDTSDTPPSLKRWDGEVWEVVNDVTAHMNQLSSSITQTAEMITQQVSKADLSRYMSFSAQDGVLIGDTATSYKVQILSDRVNILQNGAVIAYFASSKLYITEGELTSSLKIGNYALKKTTDGGIAIG